MLLGIERKYIKNMKREYKGFKSIEDNISKIIKPISKKKKDNFVILHKLQKNWDNIIGKKYAPYCEAIKIKTGSYNKIVLYLNAYNSAIAFALEGLKNDIIEKIAAYFGYKLITDIRISQELKEIESKEKQKEIKLNQEDQELIENSTKTIKDENLQKILQKLGESVLSSNNS